MGWLGDGIRALNPLTYATGMMKWIIGSILILVIFFMIWILVLAKTGMKSKPSVADRVFGIIPKSIKR